MAAPLVGRYLHSRLRREDRQLSARWKYEPPTFYEVHAAAEARNAVRVEGIAPATIPAGAPLDTVVSSLEQSIR